VLAVGTANRQQQRLCVSTNNRRLDGQIPEKIRNLSLATASTKVRCDHMTKFMKWLESSNIIDIKISMTKFWQRPETLSYQQHLKLNSTTCQNSGNDQKSKFQCDHKTKFWQ
jgi:hypothetical protein